MSSALTEAQWRAKAARFVPLDKPFIDGAFVDSAATERFATENPANGAIICELATGDARDVDRAVAAARRAFEERRWVGMSLAERKAIMRAIAEGIEANRDELALIEALEVGKAISNAHAEIAMATDWFRYYGEALDKVYGSVAATDGDLFAFSLLEPRGVVGAIVPWNFPLVNLAYKLAPALAAGNSIVLKPSEISNLSALKLAEILRDAGLPAGVVNIVPGLGSTVGEALARHDDVDFLTFTGSTRTGRALMRFAGESNGKPLMLECGGKSAQIVCADMIDEMESLAAKIARDAFWNQGQWCSARTRLIVETDIHDAVIEAIAAEARKLVPGEPLDPATNFGTISSTAQFDRIHAFLASGKAEGATPVVEGASGTPCRLSMAPTIFSDVQPGMRIAREEIFGPVLSVLRARDFDDALAKAEDSDYGLSATIWSHDARLAMKAARTLRVGRLTLRTSTRTNGSSGIAVPAEPFGASGFGVEKGLEGLRAYCRMRAVEIA